MDDQNTSQDDTLENNQITTAADSEQATVLLSLEEMIKNNIASLDSIRVELKKQKQMFDDAFNNNPVYIENTKKVKEVSKAAKSTREQIMKQPSVAQMADKIKSMRLDLKERQAALSDYLLEYQRMANGVDEVQGPDGKVWKIVNSSRVVEAAEGNK